MTWIKYNSFGFELQPKVSYEKLAFKKYFKDENDFLTMTGWDAKAKKFSNNVLYVAVNHKSKKKCILMMDKKTKITGSEPWRCQ